MATTAKQSSSVRSSASNYNSEGQEDIATIAKQISDHAEAIYQTWKARGLAPTEILNCHTPASEAFGKTLAPSPPQRSKDSPVTELLSQTPEMSNNNLEKLVNSFVHEDKARLAARNRTGATVGSIQYALKKFEKTEAAPLYPKPIIQRNSSPQPSGTKTNLNKNVPDVLMDTIEQQPINQPPQKPQTPAKPASLANHVPSWPLKNRLGSSPSSKKESSPVKEESPSRSNKKTADLMDEVSREEERLINALKTGVVLKNDKKILPEVITSTLNDTNSKWTKPEISTTTPTIQNNIVPVTIKTTKTRAPRTETVPHPELSATRNLNLRSSSSSPVRPFLTRGSVAERVMIFEKCPEMKPLAKPKEIKIQVSFFYIYIYLFQQISSLGIVLFVICSSIILFSQYYFSF